MREPFFALVGLLANKKLRKYLLVQKSLWFLNIKYYRKFTSQNVVGDNTNNGVKGEEEKQRNVYLDIKGNILGYDENNKDNKVFLADSKNEDGTFKNAVDLGITQAQFAALASLVWNESGGAEDESFAVANAVVNFLNNGGSKTLNDLDAILNKSNYYSRAVTQKLADRYANLKVKNAKYEFAAIINAFGRNVLPNDSRFTDNTNGATHWDGLDLVIGVDKSGNLIANSHRDYKWSIDSKDVLQQYYNSYGVSSRTIVKKIKNKEGKIEKVSHLVTNNSVDVSKWNYVSKGYVDSAKAIFGKSLFQKVESPGEGYTKNAKQIDYSKIKIF